MASRPGLPEPMGLNPRRRHGCACLETLPEVLRFSRIRTAAALLRESLLRSQDDAVFGHHGPERLTSPPLPITIEPNPAFPEMPPNEWA